MAIPCHIIIEGNPVIIYASRNGAPEKVLPILTNFLDKFFQERDVAGEYCDTPECLAAQVLVRFGFEICEDDYSNLRIGLNYHPDVDYLYVIMTDYTINIWQPEAGYRENPTVGLEGCRLVKSQSLN